MSLPTSQSHRSRARPIGSESSKEVQNASQQVSNRRSPPPLPPVLGSTNQRRSRVRLHPLFSVAQTSTKRGHVYPKRQAPDRWDLPSIAPFTGIVLANGGH
ncbi:hypothetical protein V6N11_039995 [Hibiscus sabdariffa]|uniref:Uncharacterized protein n=1 Tax=Hibiscus sabdariffa TaxID=183260 RepID=A0ABR2RG57_9ROSI